ncbi:Tetratricopeptide TPR_2 repeat protein, partial [sediment metagenome]
GGLGQCYLKLERYAEAAAQFAEAVRLNPQNTVVRNMLGVAYINLMRYEDAKKQFAIAIKANPEFLGAYLNLGRICENAGDYKAAVRIYAGAFEHIITKEETAVIYIRIGDAYLASGLAGKAKEFYSKARALYGPAIPEVLRKILDEKEAGISKVTK